MRIPRLAAPVLPVLLLAGAAVAHPGPIAAAACGAGDASLGNGGFEVPGVAPDSYALLDASVVPPWQTTDVANQIEVWGDTFLSVPAYEGASFAELNANSFGTLYQDVVTTPGATMNWSLHHRGRDGTDVMKVLIGDAGTADVSSDTGWDAVSPDIADDPSAWGAATGSYVVPVGQTCTRFAFRAVSSVGGPSYGNLLDGIVFSIPADPTPKPKPTAKTAPATAAATPRLHITNPPTDVLPVPTAAPGDGGIAAVLLAVGVGALAGLAATMRRRPGRPARR